MTEWSRSYFVFALVKNRAKCFVVFLCILMFLKAAKVRERNPKNLKAAESRTLKVLCLSCHIETGAIKIRP